MLPGFEGLFQEIATMMADAIDEEWSTAHAYAVFYPGCTVSEGEYARKADGVPRGLDLPFEFREAADRLRRLFREAGRPVWGRFDFTLQPDRRFDVKWGYDSCDEQGDAIFDEDAEVQRIQDRFERLTRPATDE